MLFRRTSSSKSAQLLYCHPILFSFFNFFQVTFEEKLYQYPSSRLQLRTDGQDKIEEVNGKPFPETTRSLFSSLRFVDWPVRSAHSSFLSRCRGQFYCSFQKSTFELSTSPLQRQICCLQLIVQGSVNAILGKSPISNCNDKWTFMSGIFLCLCLF